MKVEIFGKVNCPYCDQAKALLNIKRVEFDYTDFFELPEEQQVHIQTERAPTAKTFPIIFIDDIYVGGFTDIKAVI